MAASYPNLCDLAFDAYHFHQLIPVKLHSFSYSILRMKYRTTFEVNQDQRCALSETKPRIRKLVHNSHLSGIRIKMKETWIKKECSEANRGVECGTEGHGCGSEVWLPMTAFHFRIIKPSGLSAWKIRSDGGGSYAFKPVEYCFILFVVETSFRNNTFF